ncbi:Serine/threonine protein kinase PrkC, regulator of stationary phase [hydrothermal vent metagenome]|uniref:Serine/threonine protein kinase PrkC, regulator of stationary phase n=1 Tax=hydrothermal vent metagenome TaxID=652676 RepID=A0A3B0ZDJ7_9ZZZZ
MTAKNKQTTASHVASVISIPGYEIKDLLGRGGMAMVYLAIQESIGREVALKVLSPDHTDETFSERFLREARIASQLSHPNIITVYDAGIHNSIHYMSMEYIKGKNFNEARDLLSRKQKVIIIKQIADALDFAARKGFVHRDIKPENILLHQDGRAILTDFGIARANDVSKGLTETGKILGTPYFMSPEQTKGLQIDHRTDIYSLGVVLFQALAGYVPYDGPSLVAICIKHLSDPIPQLPKGLEIFQPIINICLSKKPEHRYQHASELVNALNKITDAQLDAIDAKAAAFKKAGQDHNTATMVEQKIEQPKKAPKRQSVSRAVETPSKSYRKNDSPSLIADSDDFKDLNRRKSRILIFLLILLFAAGYYKKSDLLIIWKQKGEPLAKKYLPPEIKQYVYATEEVQKKPVKPKTPTLTTTQLEEQKIQKLKSTLEKIPSNAVELANIYNQKRIKNPENAEIQAAAEKLRQWFLNRLDNLITKKDFVSANKTINEIKIQYPLINDDTDFIALTEKLALSTTNEPHLQKSRVYFAVNALNEPEGANALDELRIVLSNEPSNIEALQGLDKIAAHFKTKARNELQKKAYFKALNSTNSGLQARHTDPELLQLQDKIKSFINNKNQINTLLLKASKKSQEGLLTSPTGNSAYDLYKRVLSINPDNTQAQKGLIKIQKKILRKAHTAIEQNKFRDAATILNNAQSLFPNNQRIETAQKNLQREMDAVLPIVPKIKVSSTPFSEITDTTLQKIKLGQFLYAGFEYKNFTKNSTELTVNVYNGTNPKLIIQKKIVLTSNRGKHFFTLQLPKIGITNGNYSIELLLGKSRLIKLNLFGVH